MVARRIKGGAIAAVAALAVVAAPAAGQAPTPPPAPELAPADEGFSCRASAVRLATGTDPSASRLEPFVANRDVFPCVDADAGIPSLTQLPPDAGSNDARAVLAAAFARTRDGEPDPEAPPPAEELGVITADAGAATALLTDGSQMILVDAARATATVRCGPDGQPIFESRSSIVAITLGGPEPTIVIPPADDPDTAVDESHVDIPGEDGPIHLNHSTTTTDPATGITTHTRRAIWLENGENGDGGEIVVGEASVDTRGNPCTGRVTVVKNAVPNAGQDFTFSGLPTSASTFVLDDDDDPTQPRSRTFDLAPGSYTVSEQVPAGFQLRDVSCVGDPGATTSATGATVALERTEDVTCTFLNISNAICPAGSVLNDAGQCVVTETECPPNATMNANGECVVDQISCPDGSSQQGTQCIRDETVCPPGAAVNAQGQCVVTETRCPEGSTRNEQGQCAIGDDRVICPPGSINAGGGQCLGSLAPQEQRPVGGDVVPIDEVPGARDSRCSRGGFGRQVAVVGTNRRDRITGTNRSDRIFALGGSDRVSGGRGNDCVEGGSGNDNLDGSNGTDFLFGGSGRDIFNGGTGRDLIEGASGNDKLAGGSGSDRMYGQSGRDRLSGGFGRDRMYGGSGNDYLDGGNGADRMLGGTGNDSINAATSGKGRDFVDCGPGRDVLRVNPDDRHRNCERVLVLSNTSRR